MRGGENMTEKQLMAGILLALVFSTIFLFSNCVEDIKRILKENRTRRIFLVVIFCMGLVGFKYPEISIMALVFFTVYLVSVFQPLTRLVIGEIILLLAVLQIHKPSILFVLIPALVVAIYTEYAIHKEKIRL